MNFVLTFKSVPEFLRSTFGGQPFGHERNILITKQFLVAHVWLLCTKGEIPHLPQLGVKFSTPATVLKSNSLLPGKGRVSNARGMPPGGDVEVTN